MNNLEIQEQLEYINKVKQINKNKDLKYTILTMGCQLNENDSEKLCGMIEQMGYTKVESEFNADLIIFNTCCVRENAEYKLFGKLGEVKKIKNIKGSIIAIGGCMMQQKHIIEKINKSYPFYDILFGTHTIHKFPEDLFNILNKKEKVEDIIDIDGEIYEGIPIKRNNNIKASVTIMYGCNNFCSYCIVPYVRGRERSRNPKDILHEIKQLASEGYKEIILLGQNVNSYDGSLKCKPNLANTKKIKYGFANLLKDINKIQGIERIKFISPHPKDFNDSVIEAIKECDKICKLIHLPLQSGSSEILKLMNRKYTKDQYLSLVEKIRKKIPDVKFSTDIIVGFPSESEKDFKDTLDVIEKVNYEQVYMFIYSKRVGTPAAKMENQVTEQIKHERFNRLKELVDKKTSLNNIEYIDTLQKVLVEGKSKTNGDMLTGRTDTNKVVIFEGDKKLIGDIVNIKIISEHQWYLKGVI